MSVSTKAEAMSCWLTGNIVGAAQTHVARINMVLFLQEVHRQALLGAFGLSRHFHPVSANSYGLLLYVRSWGHMWTETTCDKVDPRTQYHHSVVLCRAQGQGLNETKPPSVHSGW